MLVLLAYRTIIAIVADAVGLLEAELLLFVLIRDHTHNYVIVLNVDDPNVEKELAFFR